MIAALSGLSRVTLEAGDDRVTLRRDPGEELVVGLPAAAEVALADSTFTGNEYIAMLAFDALVPLFGPLSFALGDYTDLVDGTEPGAATTRYQAHMRVKAEALLEAMQGMQAVFGVLDGAMAKAKAQAIASRPAARRARHREILRAAPARARDARRVALPRVRQQGVGRRRVQGRRRLQVRAVPAARGRARDVDWRRRVPGTSPRGPERTGCVHDVVLDGCGLPLGHGVPRRRPVGGRDRSRHAHADVRAGRVDGDE